MEKRKMISLVAVVIIGALLVVCVFPHILTFFRFMKAFGVINTIFIYFGYFLGFLDKISLWLAS